MIDILAKQGSVIQIGHSGENEAVRVCFSLKLFQQAFPGGTPSLHVKRNGDQSSYPVALDVDGAFAFWIVSEADTANAGIGECEIHWTVNDILAKTDRFKFLVREALSGGSEPPDPAGKAWYDKIESEIGDLSELKTAEKSSLVGAINEAAEQELPDVSAETNDMALFNNGEKAEWREIPPSVKDWNENDPNSDAYIKNRHGGYYTSDFKELIGDSDIGVSNIIFKSGKQPREDDAIAIVLFEGSGEQHHYWGEVNLMRNIVAIYGKQKKDLILPSSTEGSLKKFKITVDDTGTLSATEVT